MLSGRANTSFAKNPSPGISDGWRTKRRSGTKCRNRSCMSASWKRWNGLALRYSGHLFMYAEDWIYAPAVTKSVEILNSTKDKVLFMKAEESHSGSHAAHAAQWAMTGGGSLIRMGCHPLSTVLYLKQVEARARGERIAVSSVTADTGNVATGLPPQDHVYIKSNPIDVEDWGMLTLTFSDGTKGTIFSGDIIMGGVRNIIELYTSGGSLFANITPNNHLMSYLTNEEKL